ncbi:hypothetical protein ACFQDF_33425 [Ectobacillus funiculus]
MKKKILSFLLMFTVLLTPVLAQAKGFSGAARAYIPAALFQEAEAFQAPVRIIPAISLHHQACGLSSLLTTAIAQ